MRIDWHGYAPDQVETWADRVVEAAFEHGFRSVVFIHGAADVSARGTPGYEGGTVRERGRVKQELRKRLYGGRWRRWVADRREGRHEIGETSMALALRDNPAPDDAAPWPLVPPPAHAR